VARCRFRSIPERGLPEDAPGRIVLLPRSLADNLIRQ
jgi:hypothetical protein